MNDFLTALIRGRMSEPQSSAWCDRAFDTAARGTLDELLTVYTGASVRVGRTPLVLDDAEQRAGAAAHPEIRFDGWTLEDAARAALLLTRASSESRNDFLAAALACYESGDPREQTSWLRAVALLPGPERFLTTVVDACRTNIVPLFEAIACENPYPAQFFPERNFNQLVLKALFNNVALARIVGLPTRLNSELGRMATDYADERRAAGRSVPADIGLAIRRTAAEDPPR